MEFQKSGRKNPDFSVYIPSSHKPFKKMTGKVICRP